MNKSTQQETIGLNEREHMDRTGVCHSEGKQPDLAEDSLFSGSDGFALKIYLFLLSECQSTRDDLSRNKWLLSSALALEVT